ncbi:DUF6214 family protein [Streptomyces sp. NPDC002740]
MRLGFVDGAWVELLAVACGGRVSVEDVRAQPPLSLADLTVLADWIEGPLFERCAEHGGLDTTSVNVADGTEGPDDTEGTVGAEGTEGAVGAEGTEGAVGAEGTEGAVGTESVDGVGVADGDGAVDGGCGAEGLREPAVGGDGDEPLGPRRARPAWPRGLEGRWLAAQEYRAAQGEGEDPVLAVMRATGRSRRRSLRLIAQARDAGYLTPRHARR